MKVPFIDYSRQYKALKPEIDEAIFKCLNNGDLIFRDDLVKFENDFAAYCGCRYGIGTGSCTNAMYLCLKYLGIGPGDEIITVSHTYIATIDVIVHCGAKPVLIDIGDDFNINPDLIEPAITPRTKAIIPVHLNGLMCDMPKIMAIAGKYGLYVIEDAAQAAGAEIHEKRSGSWGDFGCFSFYPAKVLGCYGEGGMIVTNDEEAANALYLLRDHGELPSYLNPEGKKTIFRWGYNSILDNIQAAVLNVKLKYLDDFISKRRHITKMYNDKLNLIELTTDMNGLYGVHQNYVLQIEKYRRNKLKEYLYEKGIETLVSWRIPNHKQGRLFKLDDINLPKTENASQTVLSLPMYDGLTDEEVAYVIETIRSFFA